MDKLKFIKSLVFVLTFSIIFLLCLGATKVIQNNHKTQNDINLGLEENTKIEQIHVNNDKLYLLTDKQNIHIIDLKKGQKERTIYLSGSK